MALSGLKKRKHEKVAAISDGEASDSNQSDASDDTREDGNAGWANSIAKVLSTTKPKSKKTLVLSRAKKVKPITAKAEENYGFEVDGEIKEEKPIKDELDEKLKQRRNMPLALRMKPTWKEMERERTFRKVATKGVVQLFNAVRMQQTDLKQQLAEAGPLDSRRDAVLNNINKRKFLDVLMGGNRAKSEAVDNPIKNERIKSQSSDEDDDDDDDDAESNNKKKSEWNVLRKDFMTNKKIKHWDEENDSDNSGENGEDSADSDSDLADE